MYRRVAIFLITIFLINLLARSQQPQPQLVITAGEYRLEITRIWQADHAGRREPDRDFFLIIEMNLYNDSGAEICFKSDEFNAIAIGIPTSMGQVRDAYYPDLDYPGDFRGQCIDGNSHQPSLLSYDIPADLQSITLEFTPGDENTSTTITLQLQSDGNYSFNTQPTPFPTNTPRTAIIAPPAAVAATATLTLIEQNIYREVEGISRIRAQSLQEIRDGDGVIAYLEIDIQPGYNIQSTAEALYAQMYTLALASFGSGNIVPFYFSVILWDGVTHPISWQWDSQNDSWSTVALDPPEATLLPFNTPTLAPLPPVQPTAAPIGSNPVPGAAPACQTFDFAVCSQYQPAPANCDEVVSRGIPERAAACCFPSRDRDKDGMACYGN